MRTPPRKHSIRLRFAPCPTLALGVVGARTLLYNWLFAKHEGGKLVLRLADIDAAPGASGHEDEQRLLKDLHWLGLNCDEGPEIGGAFGPYRQSERLDLYKTHADLLTARGLAYYCFCHLENMAGRTSVDSAQPAHDDQACRSLSPSQAISRIKAGEKASVRFMAPAREVQLTDAVRGHLVFPVGTVGDFVIVRQDGKPTYDLACAVDDQLMQISHVIRGEKRLTRTVRQLLLCEAFGWKPPVFAHASRIDRKAKRHGAMSVHQYVEEGYLPPGLLNFLALLGWSSKSLTAPAVAGVADGSAREVLSKRELVERFSLEALSAEPSVFDPGKLRWINGEYVKRLDIFHLTRLVVPFLEKAGLNTADRDVLWLESAVDSIRSSLRTLGEAPSLMKFYFDEGFEIDPDAKVLLAEPGFRPVVEALRDALLQHERGAGGAITADDSIRIYEKVRADTITRAKNLLPMRVALTGETHGPELTQIMPLLGTKRALSRIEMVLGML